MYIGQLYITHTQNTQGYTLKFFCTNVGETLAYQSWLWDPMPLNYSWATILQHFTNKEAKYHIGFLHMYASRNQYKVMCISSTTHKHTYTFKL